MATAQRQLSPKVAQWLDTRQSALKIAKTTTTPSGQILDWVPIESQFPEGKVAEPPPKTSMPARKLTDTLRPVGAAGLELDDPSVERGPAGTVPLLRPDAEFAANIIAKKGFGPKRGGVAINRNRRNKSPDDPSPFGYFHAMSSQGGTAFGCDGFFSVWDPAVNDPAGPGDDHSILQIWLQNYSQKTQSIEMGWTVDRSLNGDTNAHVFTYYTTNGYAADGNNLGGYNRIHTGWRQYSQTVFPGIRINGSSTPGGQQLDISFKVQIYQGNVWIAVQGNWMGYYPGSLFGNAGILDGAEWFGAGDEVYSSLANPSQTHDQMGSGRQAQEGWTRSAFLRNLRVQSNLAGAMVNSNGVAESDTPTGGGANPYDVQMHMNSGTNWGSYIWVGGPTR
jgi:neprosin-like protein